MSVENVLGLSDSLISRYRDDMALFKIEAHFPFYVHLSSVLRSPWSAAAFTLGLRAIYIMLSSAKSLTVEVILSGMSLM